MVLGTKCERWLSVLWLQRVFLAVTVITGTMVGAQADEARSITVQGTGVVMAVPDLARVQVGVTTQGETAVAAMGANSERVAAVLAALPDQGVAAEDVQTASISLFPVYEQRREPSGQPPRVVAYRASNNLTVVVQDLQRVGEVLDVLVGLGVTDIGVLEFQSSAVERLRDEALVLAMGRARDKALLLSEAARVELGDLQSVTEQIGGARPVLAARAFAESAVPIAPGQQRIEATVVATFSLVD